MQTNGGRKFSAFVLIIVLVISVFVPFLSGGMNGEDGLQNTSIDPLEEWEQDLIGSDPEDPQDPGLYIRYREEYHTLNYEGWETYSQNESEIILALERVVVRRGTTLTIGGYTDAEADLIPAKEGMDDLSIDENENGWIVDIPEDTTIGKYDFEVSAEVWSESLEIFVIYDPTRLNISEEERKAYAYDEEGDRDERAFFYTGGRSVIPRDEFLPNLHPYGDDYEERPSMYEFALAGAGSSSDIQESAARLNRIVAQRSDARPEFEPLIRDASDILFFGSESPALNHDHYIGWIEKEEEIDEGEVPDWLFTRVNQIEGVSLEDGDELQIAEDEDWMWIKDGETKLVRVEENDQHLFLYEGGLVTTVLDEALKPVEGLTLEDAEKLAENGVSIYDLEEERSKVINGWCDEISFALVALLRSIGIPSRIVSLHPTPEVSEDLMEHYFVEVWIEDSMYDKSWEDSEGDWYVMDPDEWNVRFPSGIQGFPEFHMPLGETFSSRENYIRVAEELFKGEWVENQYMRRWETQDLYIFGTGQDPEPVRVTDQYLEGGEHELDYGSVSKIIGRGGGDLYRMEIDEHTKISISSEAQVEASLYVSDQDYPSIPTAITGYPFEEPPEYVGDEVVLDVTEEDTVYIGVYAPQNGDRSVEGNFGTYTLTIEEADEEELMGTEQDVLDYDETIRTEHYYSAVLMIVWALSYIAIKKL